MASIEKRTRNGKLRWYARWVDPDDRSRSKVFDRQQEAKDFLAGIVGDIQRDRYIDPDAGKVKFNAYAEQWLAMQTFDRSTREAVKQRLEKHVYPVLGNHQLRSIKPSAIQSWQRGLSRLAASHRRVILTNVSTVFSAAVDDELIAKNPCRARSVAKPKVPIKKVVPWPADQVMAVRSALVERYRVVAALGAGLGLRQGEIFGLSPDDVDWLRGTVEVQRQVKLYANGKQAFALPKGGKTRTVPLSGKVRAELAAYLAAHPARTVDLPWETPDGKPVTVPLLVSTREHTACNRNYFNRLIWKPALKTAGVAAIRENGCHALRHFYASVLLDAGESIKAVSEYLGHSDPGFTLRVYTHLMPASADRTKRAVDAVWDVPVVYPEVAVGP
jgi:integrase